jgi:DNA topoisomerase I
MANAETTQDLARRAKRGGLRYVETDSLCLRRKKSGRGFRYVDAKDRAVKSVKILDRIRALAIPPAWIDVCIADDPSAHIQAIGRDSEGRLQYRYHDDWTGVRDKVKADRLLRFGKALPQLRERLEADLRRRKTDRRYAAAAAARLIDRTLLRAGHYQSDAEEGGRGATTLLKSDVRLNGTKVFLKFTGKGGKLIEKTIRDPLLLAHLRKLKRLGKKRLFCFKDESGRSCYLTARDLNQYLRKAAGEEVTAKDFRTFAASARALAALCAAEEPPTDAARRRVVSTIMRQASERLTNTPAVARSSYVHPMVVEAFETDGLTPAMLRGAPRNGLSQAETALMRFLETTFEGRRN